MRVLIVDDDADIRLSLRMVLEDTDFLVDEAENGQVALHALAAHDDPFLVLIDHHMPLMNGPDTLRYIADHPKLARRRAFVFMSAVNDPMTIVAPLRPLLPINVLAKPFNISDVIELLTRLSDELAAPVALHEHPIPEEGDGQRPL